MPEFPIELPDTSRIVEQANLYPIPCSMIRFGVQCGNDADKAMVYTSGDGLHITIGICDMCLEELR